MRWRLVCSGDAVGRVVEVSRGALKVWDHLIDNHDELIGNQDDPIGSNPQMGVLRSRSTAPAQHHCLRPPAPPRCAPMRPRHAVRPAAPGGNAPLPPHHTPTLPPLTLSDHRNFFFSF